MVFVIVRSELFVSCMSRSCHCFDHEIGIIPEYEWTWERFLCTGDMVYVRLFDIF